MQECSKDMQEHALTDLKLKSAGPSTLGTWWDVRLHAWAGPQGLSPILKAVSKDLHAHSHEPHGQIRLLEPWLLEPSLSLVQTLSQEPLSSRRCQMLRFARAQACLPITGPHMAHSASGRQYLLWSTCHTGSEARKVLLVRGGLRLHGSHVCSYVLLPILQCML